MGLIKPPLAFYTPLQVEYMQKAGLSLFRLFGHLGRLLRPGMSGKELEQLCLDWCKMDGLEPAMKGYKGFPSSISLNPNAVATHGLPDTCILEADMVLTLDLAVRYKGYCADAAWTWIVPPSSGRYETLLQGAWQTTAASCLELLNKRSLGAAGLKGAQSARKFDLSILANFGGHGLGRNIHEAPKFDHLGQTQLRESEISGLCLSLEPIVSLGGAEAEEQADGSWITKDKAVCAQFEHNIYMGVKPGEGFCFTLPDTRLLSLPQAPKL